MKRSTENKTVRPNAFPRDPLTPVSVPRERYLTRWGKAGVSPSGAVVAHPAAYHCLDVAACLRAMLEVRPDWLDTLMRLSPFDRNTLLEFLPFIAALHDLGKFSNTFQAKVPEACRDLGSVSEQSSGATPHGALGQLLMSVRVGPDLARQWFPDAVPRTGPAARAIKPLRPIKPWLRATFGHHGSPPEARAVVGATPVIENECSPAMLEDIDRFVSDLIGVFDLDGVLAWLRDGPDMEGIQGIERSAWLVAGLVIAADWVGSDSSYFPYARPAADLPTYWKDRLPRARDRVRALMAAPVPSSSGAVLQPEWTPTPLQRAARESALGSGAQFHLIEDQTGSGKTEAALILAQRLMGGGETSGVYFGLPTTSTTVSIYDRVVKMVPDLFQDSVPVSLLHGRVARDAGVSLRGHGPSLPDSEAAAEDEAGTWLRDHRKARLLSPLAIGTVDQAMMGVLTCRHNALRILGLAGKVLIVDEVHAYDPYMVRVLETLLRLHLRYGGTVIFLTATLPRAARLRFLRAAAEELDQAPPTELNDDYPSWYSVDGAGARPVPVGTTPTARHRTITVRSADGMHEVLDVLEAAHNAGACAAWIRNTVQEAIDGAAALRARGCPVTLVHSRMMDGDRTTLDAALTASFGPKSGPQDRSGRIVISTQVIEQSLDLDFDLLVSDLAPVELLIQRCGRLWRHAHRERPALPGADDGPLMLVHMPTPAGDASRWLDGPWRGTGAVYDDHAILWRTAQLVQHESSWSFPKDARSLIARVHDGDEVPEGLQRNQDERFGKVQSLGHQARRNTIALDDVYANQIDLWPDETWAPTRIGEPAHDVYLATRRGDTMVPLHRDGWMASRISIPKRWGPLPPAQEVLDAEALRHLPRGGRFAAAVLFGRDGETFHALGSTLGLQYDPYAGLARAATQTRMTTP